MSSSQNPEISNLTGNRLEECLDIVCREGYFTKESPVESILEDIIEVKDDFKKAFCKAASQTILREPLEGIPGIRLISEYVLDYVTNIMENGIHGSLNMELDIDIRSQLYISSVLKNNEMICRRSEVLDLFENRSNILYHYINEAISTDLKQEDFDDIEIYKRLLKDLKANFDLNKFLKDIKNELPPHLFKHVELKLKENNALKNVLKQFPKLLLKNYQRKRRLANDFKISQLRWKLIETLRSIIKDDLYQSIHPDNILSFVLCSNLKRWLESLRGEPYYNKVHEALFYDKSLEKIICEMNFHIQIEDAIEKIGSHLEDNLNDYKIFQQIEKKLLEELSIEPTVLRIVQDNIAPRNFDELKEKLRTDASIKQLLKSLKANRNLKEQLEKEGPSNPQTVTITIKVYNDRFYDKLTRSKQTREDFNFNKIFKDALIHVNQKQKDGALENFYECVNNNDPLVSLFRTFKAIKQKSVRNSMTLPY